MLIRSRFDLTIHLPIIGEVVDITVTLPMGSEGSGAYFMRYQLGSGFHETQATQDLERVNLDAIQDAAILAIKLLQHSSADEGRLQTPAVRDEG
jgi:hypothetical protein